MTSSLELARITNEPDFQSTPEAGAFSLHSNETSMISVPRPGDFAFFYAPGWHTDGAVIARNFDRHVADLGSAHYGVHSAGEYSIDDQKDVWLKARKEDGFRPAKIYAQSKGVLSVSNMFVDPGFRDAFGEVDSVCFDSGVSSKEAIRFLMRNLMRGGSRLPISRGVELMCAKAMEAMLPNKCCPEKCGDHDQAVTCKEAYENGAASARTRLLACVTQLNYMLTHNISHWDLSEFGQSIPNKKIISAANDAIVNNDRSAYDINRAYGGGFTHVIDPRRAARGHAAGTERVNGVIDALMNRNQELYETRDIRPYLSKRALMFSFS